MFCLVDEFKLTSVCLCLLLLSFCSVIVHDYFNNILKAHLYELFCDWCWVVHGWRRVNFQKPRIKLIINHNIKAIYFKVTFLIFKRILNGLESVNNHRFDLSFNFFLINIFWKIIKQILLKVLDVHHVSINFMSILIFFFCIFSYRIVG